MEPKGVPLKEAKAPVLMTRAELLSYITHLEQKCVFLNAEVRKTESNAVLCIATLVHNAGGEVAILPAQIVEVQQMQFSRSFRQEDSAAVFRVRARPEEPAPEAPFASDGL